MDQIKIYAMTWNTNAQYPPPDLDCSNLLGINNGSLDELPDIYCLGFQELSLRLDNYVLDSMMYGEDTWTKACRNVLNRHGYIKIRSQRLMGFSISIFVKRMHLLHVRDVETQYTRLSVMESGLKGAVSVRMKFYGVSICFVNTHLCAHDHLLPVRIKEYNTIIESHNYSEEDTPKILYHDYIFWMGDLNFRLAQDTFDHDQIVESVKNGEFGRLLGKDQLTLVRREEQAFHELSEKLPNFAPTYKFVIGTEDYDKKRRPAWTDRILFRVNSYNYEDDNVELSLEAKNYQSHSDEIYRCSDHIPVSQEFVISVFSKELSKQKQVDAYGPVIRFHSFDEPWYLHEDRQFYYDVHTNGGRFLSNWDWIGLYKENFTSIEDYKGYAWASTCRRTDLAKTVWMSDTVLNIQGRFVLVYVSAKNSIFGMSEPFDVIPGFNKHQNDGEPIEAAIEAVEHPKHD